jgi:hypothetical protein
METESSSRGGTGQIQSKLLVLKADRRAAVGPRVATPSMQKSRCGDSKGALSSSLAPEACLFLEQRHEGPRLARLGTVPAKCNC